MIVTKSEDLKANSHNPKSKNLNSRAFLFAIDIIKFIETLSLKKISNSVLDQLLRSATSIEANIIEAKGSGSKKDFIRFYQIALKSASGTKYWIYILKDGFNINNKEICYLLEELEEISKMLGSSLLTMKGKKAIG